MVRFTHVMDDDTLDVVADTPFELKEIPLYGIERLMGEDNHIPDGGVLIPFRLYDDDNNLTHKGELSDDEDCANQAAALRYGETDMGSTRVEVFRNGEWIQEIA